ncbi:MAG: 50S ribosomal protein L24 [Candidatus Sungbacteria bacterium]|nr:50S ribosomal protein L24 [Candidatus Sungbacteria bacterium]
MKIKKGDTIKVIAGKDRGKTGKVLRVFRDESRVMVEGANIKKKHVRPKQQGKKGQVVEIPAAFSASAIMVICPSCKAATRVGTVIEGDIKRRACKKCKTAW